MSRGLSVPLSRHSGGALCETVCCTWSFFKEGRIRASYLDFVQNSNGWIERKAVRHQVCRRGSSEWIASAIEIPKVYRNVKTPCSKKPQRGSSEWITSAIEIPKVRSRLQLTHEITPYKRPKRLCCDFSNRLL